jgi:hypothetical protein
MPDVKYLIQAACIVAMALGGGLFAFGNYLEPQVDLSNPAAAAFQVEVDRDTHLFASMSRGVGVGFMALGGLGLIVPWLNVMIFAGQPTEKAPEYS